MDQMQLVMWSHRIDQVDRSRAAHAQHVRQEQAREARAAGPAPSSFLGRVRRALAWGARGVDAAGVANGS